MAVLEIINLGHPILREVAKEIPPKKIKSKKIQTLITDMKETMHNAQGVGLAAPQVAQSIQLALIEISEDSERYEEAQDLPSTNHYVIINPKVQVRDSSPSGMWEACLSIPGMRGYVERPSSIQVDFLDENAEQKTLILDDFLSIVFQHELDHLQGILYTDRLKDPHMFGFNKTLDQFSENE